MKAMGNHHTKTRSMISFDWAVKRLLRNKANFEVLEGFLGELLRRKIVIVNIGESQSNKTKADDKTNHADILVEIDPEIREDDTDILPETEKPGQENILVEVIADDKEIVIIELQFDNEDDYLQRMLYGVSEAITDYMSKGKEYARVRKVYSINIVYFDLGKGDDYVYHGITNFTGLHTQNELQLNDKQKGVYAKNIPGDLYPEYYIIKVENFDNVAKDTLDEWIYYFKNNLIEDHFKAKGLEAAREVLAYDNLSDADKIDYRKIIKHRRIQNSVMKTYYTDGIIKGRVEGREEGREEGKTEGKTEEKIETVMRMSKTGKSIEDISDATELTIEQITEILKKHGLA
jgi:hypothetical protein